MIDVNMLKGLIVTKGLSQRQVAKMLGITEKTFYCKMKKGIFNSVEMELMIDILNIKDPNKIFFAKKVTQ